MKRILSIILCLAMLSAGMCAFAAEDNSVDLIGKEAQSALGMLNSIGVFEEYSNIQTIDKDKKITRAEFADSLADILKIDEVDGALYYHDVSKEHFAYKAITALTASGHLQGNGNGMFFPDEIITQNEALKILVSVLGYDKEAEASGKSLGAYLKIASRLKLSKNSSGSGELNFENMLILLKNSIIAPMYGFEPDGDDIKYSQDKDKTILSVYHDYYYMENGRVTAANAVSIYGGSVKGTDIVIGENAFEAPAEDMSEYLGSYVNYIYSGELNVDDNAIVWLEKSERNDEVVVSGKQNIDGFDASNYKFSYYDENEKLRSVKIEKNATVIYNGGFADNIEDVFNNPYTYVRIVADKAGDYDLCVLCNYENHVVEYINFEDEYIRGIGEADNISTNPDDYEFILMRNAKNEPLKIEEFTEDMVASVYLSLDGRYIKIVVSEEKLSGEITKKGTDSDGRNYIDIADSGRIYLHGDLSADNVSIGDNIKIYLDAEGEGAYFKITPAGGVYSFILRAYMGEEDDFYVKAFTQNGSVEKFKTAEKFKVDGEVYRGSDAAEALDEIVSLLNEEVAVIEFNKAGEIKSIDTPEGKGKLKLDVPSARNSWLNGSSKLGKKLMIDDGTIIITIPKDFQSANEDEFGIIGKKNLKHWGSYLAESYKVTDTDSYADLVVMRDYSKFSASSEDAPLVVSNVSESVNDDDEIVTQIEGYSGNALVTYLCDSGYTPSVETGDILSISTNSKGRITNANKIGGADDAIGESTSYLADNNRVVVGYVNSVDGKVVKVSLTDGSTIDEYFDMSTPVIVCTEGKRNPVEVGSGADIKAFTHYGTKCSKIIVKTYQQIQKVMVIYN